MISAGFDAHYRDPLAVAQSAGPRISAGSRSKLMDLADTTASGRIVSVLEGGYDLQGLQEIGRRPCHRVDGRLTSRHNTLRIIQSGCSRAWRIPRIRESNMAENIQHGRQEAELRARASRNSKSIVKRLEDGKVPLEESVAIYERGEALKRRCEELLRQAEARVDKITTDASGQVTGTEPLDVQ